METTDCNLQYSVTGKVALQPIVSLQERTHIPFAYEALFRPDQYDIGTVLSMARHSDTLFQLDYHCRRQAFRTIAAASRVNGDRSVLFVNICPETLLDQEHTSGLTDRLVSEAGWEQSRTVLEITEETAIHNYDLFLRTIGHYRSRGYAIAIDDFGSGYAGLKMFSLVQPDYLKIDRHFIAGIDQSPTNRKIVESVVKLCNQLGITSVAEGVETKQEFKVVCELGIDLGQGYFFGRPENCDY